MRAGRQASSCALEVPAPGPSLAAEYGLVCADCGVASGERLVSSSPYGRGDVGCLILRKGHGDGPAADRLGQPRNSSPVSKREENHPQGGQSMVPRRPYWNPACNGWFLTLCAVLR